MRARVLAAATVAVLLSTGTAVPADAAPPTALAPGVTAPCPKLPTPAVTRPPRPTPPEPVPAQRAVGGEALATPGLVVPPGTPAPPPVTATSWLVADLDSGEVLGGCGPHEYATPASVQKLLLAATMLPKLDPKQVATVTREDLDIEPGSSAVGLLVGGRYPVETVWLGLLLQSGNEAANLLARLGAGSAEAGVREMNAEARRLGALQTHAVTPSGLDGPGQFTSAYDLALIARACFANPTFQRYALTERAQIPAQPALRKRGFQIQNENPLIYDYPGALGGKTGFTDLARHTYVGAAERNGRRLVVTLLNAERRPVRAWEQGARLLDWGFSLPPDSSVGRLVQPGEVSGDGAAATPSTGPDAGAAVAAGRSSGGAPEWLGGAVVGGSAGLVGLLAALLAVGRRRRRPRRRAVQWD
ncbi:D-alanyl-D-alanine carboxypeptidase family protein [Micromonospora purpureochromogenes]|uniref:D-alanyl-D-alanine carboxypeptidase family protein n=1 Tax=Micromonospora purpureochromogenes TaxID=47872 RepID=UPI0036384887